MANLYRINKQGEPHGWIVVYRIHFRDGTHARKKKFSRQRVKAQIYLKEASDLETRSRSRELSRHDVIVFKNLGYLNDEEAARITAEPLPSTSSWNELAKKYEDWSRVHCRRETHTNSIYRLNRVVSDFKHTVPGEVSTDDVRSWIEKRLNEAAAATVRKELTVLRKLLDYAGGENPARTVSPPRTGKKRIPRPFYHNELQAFFVALRRRRKYFYGYLVPAIMIYLYAGLRPSEILRLRLSDVRAGKFLIHGATKTGEVRSVDIHPKLEVYVRACLRRGGPWLIGGEKEMISNSFGRYVRLVIKDAGLKEVTPYSLRHTWISALLRKSGDIRYTMEKAGHKQLSTTLGYLHVVPSKSSPIKDIDFGD